MKPPVKKKATKKATKKTAAAPKDALTGRQRAFLAAFAVNGNVSQSSRLAKLARRDHYRWLKECPEYVPAFEDADEIAIDRLETQARKWALEGEWKPVFYQGKQCGKVREKSVTMNIFLLKARRPQIYRDNYTVEHTGAGGAPLEISVRFLEPGGETPKAA